MVLSEPDQVFGIVGKYFDTMTSLRNKKLTFAEPKSRVIPV
jgi:hypothetical protein